MNNSHVRIVKKDNESATTFYEMEGFARKWVTRRWGNASVVSDEQASGRADVQVCDGEHRKKVDLRDTTRAAIKASEQCLALLSKKTSKRAERSWVRDSSSIKAGARDTLHNGEL
jgi:hypothetical protein